MTSGFLLVRYWTSWVKSSINEKSLMKWCLAACNTEVQIWANNSVCMTSQF
jgi:hypothetical protein